MRSKCGYNVVCTLICNTRFVDYKPTKAQFTFHRDAMFCIHQFTGTASATASCTNNSQTALKGNLPDLA